MKKIIQILTIGLSIFSQDIFTKDTTVTIINETDTDIKVKVQSIYQKRKKDNPAKKVTRHDMQTITLTKAQTPWQQEIVAKTDKITGVVTPGKTEVKAVPAKDNKGVGTIDYDGCFQFIEVTDLTTNKTVKWHRSNNDQCVKPKNIAIKKGPIQNLTTQDDRDGVKLGDTLFMAEGIIYLSNNIGKFPYLVKLK
jgi:hypothetical protein